MVTFFIVFIVIQPLIRLYNAQISGLPYGNLYYFYLYIDFGYIFSRLLIFFFSKIINRKNNAIFGRKKRGKLSFNVQKSRILLFLLIYNHITYLTISHKSKPWAILVFQ